MKLSLTRAANGYIFDGSFFGDPEIYRTLPEALDALGRKFSEYEKESIFNKETIDEQ